MRSALVGLTLGGVVALLLWGALWAGREGLAALVVGLALLVAFAVQLFPAPNLYDGGEADTAYQAALITRASLSQLWADAYYPDLPPFQPPALYVAGGLLKRALGLSPRDGLKAWILLSIGVELAVLYAIARVLRVWYALILFAVFGIGSWSVSYLYPAPATRGLWSYLLFDPAIVISTSLAVLIAVFSEVPHLWHRPKMRLVTISALSAMVTLIQPWPSPLLLSVLAASGAKRYLDGRRQRGRAVSAFEASSGVIGVIVGAMVALPYWGPLALAAIDGRYQNPTVTWASLETLEPTYWSIGFGFGLPLVGLLWALRSRRDHVATLAMLAVAGSLVFASAYLSLPIARFSYFYHHAPVLVDLSLCVALALAVDRRLRGGNAADRQAGDLIESIAATQAGSRVGRAGVCLLASLLAVVSMPIATWNRVSDNMLGKAWVEDKETTELARLIHELLPADASLVVGESQLIAASFTGRYLVYVPVAYYGNPLAENAKRKADVVELLSTGDCSVAARMRAAYGLGGIVVERTESGSGVVRMSEAPTRGIPNRGSSRAESVEVSERLLDGSAPCFETTGETGRFTLVRVQGPAPALAG
jgi:hypothetical protein